MERKYQQLFVCLLLFSVGHCLQCYTGSITKYGFNVKVSTCGYGKNICVATNVVSSTLFGTVTTKTYGCETDLTRCQDTCNRIRALSNGIYIKSCQLHCCGADRCNTQWFF